MTVKHLLSRHAMRTLNDVKESRLVFYRDGERKDR
jgi:hypothetical protein